MRFPIFIALALFATPFTAPAKTLQTIPFEFRNGLIWVQAVSNHGTLSLLLDSGAGASVLSLDAVRRLGVPLGAPETVQRVNAQTTAYHLPTFRPHLGGAPLAGNWLGMDLRDTAAACRRPIDGLIGQDFFRDRIVQIDFAHRLIRLLDCSPAGAVGLPLRRLNDAMCLPVAVNGAPARWTRLDTGCDDGLHWVGAAPGVARGSAVSVGLSRSAVGDRWTTLELGFHRVDRVRTTLHPTAIFPGEAGLLGNAVLSRFTVTIDAVAGRVLLARN